MVLVPVGENNVVVNVNGIERVNETITDDKTWNLDEGHTATIEVDGVVGTSPTIFDDTTITGTTNTTLADADRISASESVSEGSTVVNFNLLQRAIEILGPAEEMDWSIYATHDRAIGTCEASISVNGSGVSSVVANEETKSDGGTYTGEINSVSSRLEGSSYGHASVDVTAKWPVGKLSDTSTNIQWE